MSLFGTPIAQSVAGAAHAERLAARNAEKKRTQRAEPSRRDGDAVEINSSQAEDAVRHLKGNSDEETRDDRAEQDHYRPQRPTDEKPGETHRHIDVQG
jgi:hypothetical protein